MLIPVSVAQNGLSVKYIACAVYVHTRARTHTHNTNRLLSWDLETGRLGGQVESPGTGVDSPWEAGRGRELLGGWEEGTCVLHHDTNTRARAAKRRHEHRSRVGCIRLQRLGALHQEAAVLGQSRHSHNHSIEYTLSVQYVCYLERLCRYRVPMDT